MSLSDRLKNERKKIGLSQKDFAAKLGMNARTYASYERGERDISTAVILNICRTLNISSDLLLGTNSENASPHTEDKTYILESSKIRKIPIYESVSAGFGSSAQDYIIDYMPMFIESDSEAEETLGIKVMGNSMYPKIEDGDIVQVRKQSTVDNGRVAVVLIDGEDALVKRFYHEGNRIVLKSFNPEYPPRYFEREDMNRVQVLGLVQSVIKKL